MIYFYYVLVDYEIIVILFPPDKYLATPRTGIGAVRNGVYILQS